jgi:cation diffusion facilitator family transporter
MPDCRFSVLVSGVIMQKTVESEARKQSVALTSLAAAFGLTGFKIVVGLLTGSLGILAEAAHSGLDTVAAAATYFAVRTASRPPDRNHRYGHGKIENLSALFETVLLLATCVWIAYAAIHRMLEGVVEVEVTVWSFLVMLTSIVIDWSRSRALYRVARETNSQALEADALHFETDIWSSAVVIIGLICVKAAEWAPAVAWLRHADAVAALAVAVIAAVVTVRLGARTVEALMDAAPANMEDRILRVAESVGGVIDCHSVRFRYSGPTLFIDCHVSVDGGLSVSFAHDIADRVELAIQAELPGADVTVHTEPAGSELIPQNPGTN